LFFSIPQKGINTIIIIIKISVYNNDKNINIF
jgi:hypothetical protein